MVRHELKKDTLIRNIKRAVTRAQHKDLPARIKEVYAFGGILRDKEKAHDFDVSLSMIKRLSKRLDGAGLGIVSVRDATKS